MGVGLCRRTRWRCWETGLEAEVKLRIPKGFLLSRAQKCSFGEKTEPLIGSKWQDTLEELIGLARRFVS